MAAWTCLLYRPLGPYGEQIQATKVKHLGMDVLGRCGPRAPGIAPTGTVLLPWRGETTWGLTARWLRYCWLAFRPLEIVTPACIVLLRPLPAAMPGRRGCDEGGPSEGPPITVAALLNQGCPEGSGGEGTAWQGLLSLSSLVSAKSSTWWPCRRRGSGTRYNCVLRSKVDDPGRTQLWCAAPGHRWHSARWRT